MNIKRGILLAFNANAYTAEVLLLEATSHALTDIQVSNMVDGSAAIVGALCAVLFFNEHNPDDAVVIAVFGNGQARIPEPPPGRITFIESYRHLHNAVVPSGTTSLCTVTGGSSGIPQGVRGVLYSINFSSPVVGALLQLFPYGASDPDGYVTHGMIVLANTVCGGTGLLAVDDLGRIDMRAVGGNCTVTLYTGGYVF